MAKAKPKQYTTYEIDGLMLKRFEAPAWALLPGVASGTGARHGRTADWMAMSLWPSRGLHLHGFEVKMSRSDWIKEMKDPAKAEAIAKYCEFWTLVIGHADIVQPGELPHGWGLMVAKGGRLVTITEGEMNKKPAPMDRTFLAAWLRRVQEHKSPEVEIEKRVTKRLKDDREFRKDFDSRWETKYKKLQTALADFEKESGIRIDEWSRGNVAKIVALLQRRGTTDIHRGIEQMRQRVQKLADDLAGAASDLERMGEDDG